MTATPSVLQSLAPAADHTALLAVQSSLQSMLDAVPVALLGFHQHGSELRLISANAVARRLEGLRSVRNPGASAANVFVLLSGTHLQEQLAAVAVAVASNLVFKTVMASAAGGPVLRGPMVRAFGAVLVGLGAGLAALHALA